MALTWGSEIKSIPLDEEMAIAMINCLDEYHHNTHGQSSEDEVYNRIARCIFSAYPETKLKFEHLVGSNP